MKAYLSLKKMQDAGFKNGKVVCCDHIEISIGNLSTLRVQIGNQVKRDF